MVLRSVGLEPGKLSPRLKLHFIARLAPLVEANFNFIELGPRGTGKSYFFSEFSPYSTLISGGQATKAMLFYNNARKRIGLVGFWDTVAFDEVSGIKIKDPDTIQIMKDYMANGRFSRGVEVIADASMAFVGNIDLSVEQVVNSTEYDLFQPLPPQFDLAVMDRFACYVPGWEMPKNSSEYLTSHYGFITDYLAEAFHYQFSHTNRYEEVSQRVRLGSAVEGRDEKGIKKTVCAFLKILHPGGAPTDDEFEEYVAYAVEGRRRVKEQMNKRKPDEEFAHIHLSYLTRGWQRGRRLLPGIPSCRRHPEPGQERAGRKTSRSGATLRTSTIRAHEASQAGGDATRPSGGCPGCGTRAERTTFHYHVRRHRLQLRIDSRAVPARGKRADGGGSVHSSAAPNPELCPLLRNGRQSPAIKKITLITGYDDKTQLADIQDKLGELQQSLLELDVVLDIRFHPTCMTGRSGLIMAG